MAETMRAILVKEGGGIGGLFIDPAVAKPTPAPNQCLIRVKAFGLNRGDTMQREGMYPPPKGIVDIMGLEFSGIVEEVGEGEDKNLTKRNWKKGDEVFGLLYGGGYAEYVICHKDMLIAKPSELSWETCGGFCEVWMTALQALHLVGHFDPERVKSILWHAGSSSVGIAGIQLSLDARREATSNGINGVNGTNGTNGHHVNGNGINGNGVNGHGINGVKKGLKVFATTRSDDKCDMCVKQLGCDGAVNTKAHDDWSEAVKELNGGNGIDLVFDFVGAPYFQSNLNVLAMDGAVINLGLMGGPKTAEPVDISPIIMKRARFEGSTLRTRSLEYQIALRDLFVEKVLPGVLEGRLEHVVDKVLQWDEIARAHQMLERNETKGKIVCTIDWN